MTMVMASMLPGPCRIRDFSCAHCQQFCKVPSSCSASQWGCHLKDISLSFSLPPQFFLCPSVPPSALYQSPGGPVSERVCVSVCALQPSPTHQSRHKVNILHSKALQSDWTRSVCLGRHNPIYVCNEVYSPRTNTMCSLQNAEARWPIGQVFGRTCTNLSVFQGQDLFCCPTWPPFY